ncbi:MAG: DUF4915 domain-containing protein [Desulfosporosinus sp.]|nr:DUF4915 domain-containing protein [Desulfosporosinus sp.]
MLLYGLRNDPNFSLLRDKFLVTCNSDDSDNGGIFLMDFERNMWQKVFEGDCRGAVRVGERIFVVTNTHGFLIFDADLISKMAGNLEDLDVHGIVSFDEKFLFVAETKRNAVGFYDIESLERIGEIKFNMSDMDENHINDLWIHGSKLMVSMFTPHGNWRWDWNTRTKPDAGCIIEVDITSLNLRKSNFVDPQNVIILSGLCMPHSVIIKNGRTAYCDSMNFSVVIQDNEIIHDNEIIQYQGFTRGLVIQNDTIFCGQSRLRHLSKFTEKFSNRSMECGIYVTRANRKISRFIPLPASQVYQIMPIKMGKPEFPDIIEFGTPASDAYLLDIVSWHDIELWRWTANLHAEVMVNIPDGGNSILIINLGSGFPGNYRCDVGVDGRFQTSVAFPEPGHREIELAIDSGDSSQRVISFEVPFLWNPNELLQSEDRRMLGISVKSIEVGPH